MDRCLAEERRPNRPTISGSTSVGAPIARPSTRAQYFANVTVTSGDSSSLDCLRGDSCVDRSKEGARMFRVRRRRPARPYRDRPHALHTR